MKIANKCLGPIIVTLSLFLTAYCTVGHAEQASAQDPFIRLNRVIFKFNDVLDVLLVKPIATLYNKIIPRPLNIGIHNFYNNINELPTIANDILQLKFYQTANDSWRFFVNSTLGIGGLIDVGSRIGLPHYVNDFGLTMAHYGWESSAYLVVPLFGPSTIRDTIEIPVDYYYFSIYPHINSESARWQLYLLGVVDRRAQLLKFQDVLNEAIFDKYVFVRDAYLQRRRYQIEQNKHRSTYEIYYAKKGVVDAPVQESLKPTPGALTPKEQLFPIESEARPSPPDANI